MGRSEDGNGSSVLILVNVVAVAARGVGCCGHD